MFYVSKYNIDTEQRHSSVSCGRNYKFSQLFVAISSVHCVVVLYTGRVTEIPYLHQTKGETPATSWLRLLVELTLRPDRVILHDVKHTRTCIETTRAGVEGRAVWRKVVLHLLQCYETGRRRQRRYLCANICQRRGQYITFLNK